MGHAKKVVVVGAGISGLACAYRLKQLGVLPLVLEASERAGGLITTVRRNGLLFEAGPQCPRFPPPVWRLVRELNLEAQFVAGDPKAKRYILRHGRLHLAPFSPGELLRTSLISFSSKLRILGEVFATSHPPADEESLADFIERKFGVEVLNNLVDPIIATVFLGDSRKMGMESAFPVLAEWERSQGSLARGALGAWRARRSKRGNDRSAPRIGAKRGTLRVTQALPSLGSFRSGMGSLPERLAEVLKEEIRYKAPVTSAALLQGDDGPPETPWQISLTNGERIAAENLVLAVPAPVAAKLLKKSAPELASELHAIEYAPMYTVSLAYQRTQVANTLDGFGFMVPRREGLATVCTFWNSSLFKERAPEGEVLITSFAGREINTAPGRMLGEECAPAVEAENARILGITGTPVDRMVWTVPQALPQYNVGHSKRVREIDRMLRTLPKIYVAGNFLKGRSLGDCVETATRVAEDLHSRSAG
jgi:oxygen-dependent protoporphyrinogen oxidase